MPLGERKLPPLPDHLNSPPVFSEARVIRSLVLCVCFVDRCLSFFFWSLHSLSVRLRYTDSDYPFDIFKLFSLVLFCQIGSLFFCVLCPVTGMLDLASFLSLNRTVILFVTCILGQYNGYG